MFINKNEKEQPIKLRAYADSKEKIILKFNPLKMSDEENHNPMWEEWHCYKSPLIIYLSDYEKLLEKYFDEIFPAVDVFNGEPIDKLDVCFDNWLGRNDFEKIISAIEADLEKQESVDKDFYIQFLEWLKTALEYTDIIVVEGNL